MHIVLKDEVRNDLMEAYDLNGAEDLIGAYVLLVGELKVSAAAKKYMRPVAAQNFALYIPKEN